MKKYAWFFINLALTILVYCDKIFDIKIWYVDNLVVMFFVLNVLIASLLLIVAITMGLSSTYNFVEESQKMRQEINSNFSKFSRFLSFFTTAFFGVTGCWWFFTFSCIELFSTLFIFHKAKNIVKAYKATHPDFKMPEKNESKNPDKKAKFKFLKTT